MGVLYQRSSMPLDQFLDKKDSFAKDEQDTHLFYAQSWALVHFLTMSEGMEGGAKLNQFFFALQRGTEQKKAFQETFGEFKQVQKSYDRTCKDSHFKRV